MLEPTDFQKLLEFAQAEKSARETSQRRASLKMPANDLPPGLHSVLCNMLSG
jgi:hypothetical protein